MPDRLMTARIPTTPAPPPPEPLPTVEEFFLRTPLYEYLKINAGNRAQIQEFQYPSETLDAHCVWSGRTSIFHYTGYRTRLEDYQALKPRTFISSLTCRRDDSHEMQFWFLVLKGLIAKV